MSDLIGQTLGPYRILREIGRGGMAIVYEAYQPSLDRRVAIKVPHAWLLADPKFVERFRREARLAANLTHPHIVTIHEIGEEQGTPFIVMEWLEGMPLDRWLAAAKPSLQAVLQALLGVGVALDAAHAKGVVHRDIKPSNIMITADRGGVLTDFGIAKLLAQATQSTSGVMGTPNYMAPEVLKGQPTTAASDIYALGVMLYQIVVGRLPFQGENPTAVAYQHANELPPDPRSFNPSLPPQTAALLLQALAKDPRQRPTGAERLIQGVLVAWQGTQGGQRQSHRFRQHPNATGRCWWRALLVLFVVALFAWALTRDSAPPTPPPIEVTQVVSDKIASVSPPAPTHTATLSSTLSTTPAPPLSPTPTSAPTLTSTPIPTPTRITILPGNGSVISSSTAAVMAIPSCT